MAKRTVGEELIEAMGDAVAHAKGEIELPSRTVHVPDEIAVAAIREGLGLSQTGFAERFGFKVAALRDWEQGRRQPERSARILLAVIEKEPEAVDRALAVT